MQRTVAQKMGIKSGSRAFFKDAPDDARDSIDIPTIDVSEQLEGSFDYIHLFALSRKIMNHEFPLLKKHLQPTGMMWVSWPKSKQLGSDLTVKEVIRIGYEHGLVESTCLSINATWSALKFTFPKKGKVYKNSYGTLKQALVFLICLYSMTGFAQQSTNVQAREDKYTIPFRLTAANNIAVPAVFNRTDSVVLMFHLAANAVTVTEEAMKKIKTLRFDDVDTVKSWGGGDNHSRFSKNNLIQVAGLSWPNTSVWENVNSGPETDGKFGIDLFKDKVIELNQDTRKMIIHSMLPSTKGFKKFDLVFENDMMFIEASCKVGDSIFNNRFLIHSGYSGSILLDDKFAADHNLERNLVITGGKDLKDSFGNVIKTKQALLPRFIIGEMVLTDVPVGFFSGSLGRQKMSILGGDILKRFNIIIDNDRKHIYLKESNLHSVAYTKL